MLDWDSGARRMVVSGSAGRGPRNGPAPVLAVARHSTGTGSWSSPATTTAGDLWTIHVFDAADGTELPSVDGYSLAGVADVTGAECGVPRTGRTRLACRWTARVTTLWIVDGLDARRAGPRAADAGRAWDTATQDVDRDGIPARRGIARRGPSAAQRIVALDADLPVPAGRQPTKPRPASGSGRPFSDGLPPKSANLLMVRNDGFLVSFDHDLHAISARPVRPSQPFASATARPRRSCSRRAPARPQSSGTPRAPWSASTRPQVRSWISAAGRLEAAGGWGPSGVDVTRHRSDRSWTKRRRY